MAKAGASTSSAELDHMASHTFQIIHYQNNFPSSPLPLLFNFLTCYHIAHPTNSGKPIMIWLPLLFIVECTMSISSSLPLPPQYTVSVYSPFQSFRYFPSSLNYSYYSLLLASTPSNIDLPLLAALQQHDPSLAPTLFQRVPSHSPCGGKVLYW